MKVEKVERRGKYPGTKVHLGAKESQLLIDIYNKPTPAKLADAGELFTNIGKQIVKLLIEYPNLMKERTPEEIQAELENEYESSKQKLAAISGGKDWKQVKVK